MTADPDNAAAGKDDGLYVYCVARGDGHYLLGPIGLDARLVYTLDSGGIRAVVHNCQAEPYQSEDPQVVKRWVMAHQRVVRAATEAFGTVLPMTFDMIVRAGAGGGATAAVKAWLDEGRDRFAHLLDRLADKAEFGVQVFWDREAIAATLVEDDDELRRMQDEARSKPKGLAHLLQQKLAKAVRTAMEEQADRFAQDFYARIRRCVEDVRVDKLKKGNGGKGHRAAIHRGGVPKQMLLNLSCLVQAGSGDLGQVLDEIQETKGISVRFTGPWPLYSFVGR